MRDFLVEAASTGRPEDMQRRHGDETQRVFAVIASIVNRTGVGSRVEVTAPWSGD